MAPFALITEEETQGKVNEISAEIKAAHGIDFVPYLYRSIGDKRMYKIITASSPGMYL